MSADPGPELADWMARLGGAAAGSAISVAYLLPQTRREAATRFLIGLVTGLVFGPPAGILLAERLRIAHAIAFFEISVMGAAAASLCAWWALGVLARFAEGFGRVWSGGREGGRHGKR